MKALRYLQKVGAIPPYDSWDILMAIVVIISDFYSVPMLIEPDIIEWVQEAENDKDFKSRCDAIWFSTSGDIRALFPHIYDKPAPFLKSLLEAIVDLKVSIYRISNPAKIDQGKEQFAEDYNDMVGLKGNKRFPSKSAIIHTYCSGTLTDMGQEILSSLAGTEKGFNKEVEKLKNFFSFFVTSGELIRVVEMENKDERENPFDGGYQVEVKVQVPGVDEAQECTLHWAPWPTAKTKSANQIVRSVCDGFTSSSYSQWLSDVEQSIDM